MKIAVAMSGGVDSSVTAALMSEKYGKENVFGVTMRLFCYGEKAFSEKNCCSVEAVNDAKSVCDHLGIAHYALDFEKEFEEAVIKDFIREYQKGRTPIPCIPCNSVIKFDLLLNKVRQLGAEAIATGHFARIKEVKGDRLKVLDKKSDNSQAYKLQTTTYQLLKGLDETKDQTYFLYGLNQDQLANTTFPLGEMRKTEVRKLAAKYSLKTAEKKESQGICFVTEGRVTDWLAGKIKNKPGKIVDTKGEEIGEHEGIIFYTVGQRKRIGGGFTEPMYVVGINPSKNEVVIGNEKELYGKELEFEKAQWVSGKEPKFPLKCTAKIRYNMEESPCVVTGNRIVFNKPQRAITPGQSIVFYRDDVVLGGGVINVRVKS